MGPISVTFDSCSLDTVVWPETSQHRNGEAIGRKVRAAIEAGRVQGFFCEPVVILESVQNKERSEVFGSTRLETQLCSPADRTINITIAVKQDRNPPPPKFCERIQVAKAIGMCALKGPARIGGICFQDNEGNFFKSYNSVSELAACLDKVHNLATAIAAHGVGQAVAVTLGLQFLTPDEIAKPTLWSAGFRRAKSKSERDQVNRAIAEWADGDSVATHYGHGVELFCTEDKATQSAGQPSVFDDTNRAWLQKDYGIKFVSLAELAERLE
jgi:hypothetical protein